MTVEIATLGHQGDGVTGTDPSIYVPLSLPGETVEIEAAGGRGRLTAIRTASPDRVAPPCPHFGSCGGCAVQHLAEPSYHAWKRELVAGALSARGLSPEIAPVVPAHPGTRRRATFSATVRGRTTRLGYHGRMSHDVVDIESCLVLTPGLQALLAPLRDLARLFAPPSGSLRMTVTETETGFDVALEDGREPGPRQITELAARMERARIARVSLAGETVMTLAEPMVAIGSARVALPPAGFLQATAEAEAALSAHVQAALSGARRAIDLFSGLGTFALRLAEAAKVHMVESDRALLDAGLSAARRTPGLKAVSGEARDLFAFPVSAKELSRFDAIVFDPPRAGAAAEAAEIAVSAVKTVVAVSCNPATLARDLRILVDGGYRIDAVTPVDQFLYSPHIEVVAVLKKGAGGPASAPA